MQRRGRPIRRSSALRRTLVRRCLIPCADLPRGASASRVGRQQRPEDGLIARRSCDGSATATQTFVEIGAATARTNCTPGAGRGLGGRGAWSDGDPELHRRRPQGRRPTRRGACDQAIVTSANVGTTCCAAAGVAPRAGGAPCSTSTASDLWVLRAMLRTIAPRLLVVEYNSTFPPGEFWTRRNRHELLVARDLRARRAACDAMRWAADAAGYDLVACDRSRGQRRSSSDATWPRAARTAVARRSRRSTGRTSRWPPMHRAPVRG